MTRWDLPFSWGKAITNWNCAWKIETIKELNPCWGDLYPNLIWREVLFVAKQTLDNHVEHMDSGMRRNDEIRVTYPQIFLQSHINVTMALLVV